MAKRKKGKKRVGHYCWCCDCYRSNERFSGKNHGRHLCRECAKLGPEELAYRQGVRNIDRLMYAYGFVGRKKRHIFERYLHHPNPRIRQYAQDAKAYGDRERQAFREAMLADEAAWERWCEEHGRAGDCPEEPEEVVSVIEVGSDEQGIAQYCNAEDDDIPF